MFIEHRTYTVRPAQLHAYLDDYGQHGWAVHSAHTPCIGHYYTEAGNLFRIISLWRYESFEDRLARRAALNADPQWQDVMGRISPMVTDIRSNLLMPSPCFAKDDWYRPLYEHIDAMRMDGFLAGLSDDVQVVFGNYPAAVGRAQVREAIGAFWASIGGLRHRFENVVQNADQTLLEGNIDYTRKDGRVVTVPVATVLKRRGDKVSEMRIYIDVAPVYA